MGFEYCPNKTTDENMRNLRQFFEEIPQSAYEEINKSFVKHAEYYGIKAGKKKQEKLKEIGQVYFIEYLGIVKIGMTHGTKINDLKKRIDGLFKSHLLHTVNILHYEPGGEKREKQLHKKFKKSRIVSNREWFIFSKEIKKYIQFKEGAKYETMFSCNHKQNKYQ